MKEVKPKVTVVFGRMFSMGLSRDHTHKATMQLQEAI